MIKEIILYEKCPFSALFLFIVLLSLPFFTGSYYIWQIITIASIYSVWAMSWDIFSGYTGQISFGHAFFIGVGGFLSAIINKRFGIDPWFTIFNGNFCFRLLRTYRRNTYSKVAGTIFCDDYFGSESLY